MGKNIAEELIIANKKLAFQNEEKEKRAAELVIANKELVFQNEEKEKRAAELTVANKELVLQNTEKEKKAEELIIANSELAFQNKEKEKRAAELVVVNIELAFQNDEKEKRTAELLIANDAIKKSEQKVVKGSRLYSFVSHINQTIVKVKDEETLFKEACRIAIDLEKFKMVWIGMFDKAFNEIVLVEQNAIPEEHLKLFTHAPYQNNIPQDYVLKTGKYYVSNDIENDIELQNWKPLASERGIRSCMVLPLRKEGKIIGIFNLYADEVNFFDKEEIALLVEVAGDISFALDMFENTKKQKSTEELLVHSEKRFRALIEHSMDMKTLTNHKGELIYGSPSITKILGYSKEDYINKPASGFIHPDDLAEYMQSRKSILDTPGKSFKSQQRLLHKNGKWIWSESTVTNMFNEPGIHALVTNFRDISEKKAIDNLREFERNNLNALINNTTDLMWSVDKNFNLITFNEPFFEYMKRISGKGLMKGESVLSTSFSREQLTRYKKYYERAFSGEAFTEPEYTDVPVELWSEISFNPIHKEDKVVGTACHSRDITNRKKGEENLKQNENRFREFFESAPEALTVTDVATLRFIRANNNTLKLLKYSKDELFNIGPLDISSALQPDGQASQEKAMEIITGVMKGDKPVIEWLIKDANGKEILCELRLVALSGIGGAQIMSSFIDITARKHAEKERENITADLLQRNKDLEQFTYIVSHNLRAPVANIIGFSEALRTINLEETEKEEMMFGLSASVLKLNGVILDLNNILQIKNNLSEKRETVSFSHLIKNIQVSISSQIKKEHVQIKTDFSEIDKMLTLKSYLYSIFYNLISNSIKFRQTGLSPVIEIKSYILKDKVELHYRDNGLGIDLKKKGDQVFGLYKRFHEDTQGKGLGLFMTKTQVETLGGKINIESEVNKGTKFIIQFPI